MKRNKCKQLCNRLIAIWNGVMIILDILLLGLMMFAGILGIIINYKISFLYPDSFMILTEIFVTAGTMGFMVLFMKLINYLMKNGEIN